MTPRIDKAHRLKALAPKTVTRVTALALTVGLLCGPMMTATADPPLSIAEAKVQIERLQTDAAAIGQEYAGVKEKIDISTAKLRTTQADVKAQGDKIARMRVQVGQVALARFQNRNLDTTAQLFFNSDTEGFLSQISTVEKISENQNAVLQNFQAEQATLAGLQRSAETDLASLAEQQKQLDQLRASSEAKLVESEAVLAKLTAAERQRLAAEEKQRADAAAEAAKALEAVEAAAGRSRVGASSRSSDRAATRSPAKSSTSKSTRGATALAFAKRQVGKPYQLGATGPSAYDCSGLTGDAWQAAGVAIPRTSQQQFTTGRAVAKADLQPGDLVFFYNDLSHVGLYVGNGIIVQAARPGKPVGYAAVSSMPYAGARRPG